MIEASIWRRFLGIKYAERIYNPINWLEITLWIQWCLEVIKEQTCKKMGELLFEFCAWDEAGGWDDDWRMGDDGMPIEDCLDNSEGMLPLPETDGVPIRSENRWPNASQSFSTSAYKRKSIVQAQLKEQVHWLISDMWINDLFDWSGMCLILISNSKQEGNFLIFLLVTLT